MISCREVMGLPSVAKLRLVAGASGLDKLVRWVHFIDLPDVLPWVQGGELLIITGIGLQGKADPLRDLVQGIAGKKLAGLIVNLGPYIQEIPQEVADLANQAGFPIFTLPWEVKIIEVTREICSHIVLRQTEERSVKDFLEQLLLYPLADTELLLQRAAYYGYDLSRPHQVVIISPRRLAHFLPSAAGRDEKDLIAFKMRFENIVREALRHQGKRYLQMLWADDIVLLLPCERQAAELDKNKRLLSAVVNRLLEELPGFEVAGALGGVFERLEDGRRSYLQAMRILRSYAGAGESAVWAYDELGFLKLLFEIEPEKLVQYHRETLERLWEYDRRYKQELLNSLGVYFEENCNAVQTAKRLFIHRNTLDYRLKKIEEVTGRQLDKPHDRLTLQIGILVGRQLQDERQGGQ